MKKYIILGISLAAGLLTLASCNQALLDIPKKGVVTYEAFYDGSEENAEAATLAIYSQYMKSINLGCTDEFPTWVIAPSYYVLTNAPSDDTYYGSGGPGDHTFGLEINEFRPSFGSNSTVVRFAYRSFYQIIYACNVMLANFDPATSAKVARNVAEARALRAMAHLFLATYWGTPPMVDQLLGGEDRPTNSDHDTLMNWIISELDDAAKDLPSRGSKNNKEMAVRLSKEAAWAFEGKAQMQAEKYADAKVTLKKVIDSGMFELVSGPEMWNLFHVAGDCSTEKVFEFNFVYNENLSGFAGFYNFQRSNSCTWRDLKKLPMPFMQINDGWGGGGNPSQSFVNAIMENEPNSYRRKAWLISYEELLTDYSYTFDDDATMTKEQKLLDPRRGLSASRYFGNVGYFMIKYMPLETELCNPNDQHLNDNNTVLMRYAEVLLMYAEACAQTNDASGLTYLNMVATRAGAPTYASLTLDNVKKEKRFEMFMEGCRFPDLVRWGDAATVLKDQGKSVPSFTDPFDASKGIPHKAVVDLSKADEDGWGEGFKANKNELMPFPLGELQINPWNEETGEGIKQNPGWN